MEVRATTSSFVISTASLEFLDWRFTREREGSRPLRHFRKRHLLSFPLFALPLLLLSFSTMRLLISSLGAGTLSCLPRDSAPELRAMRKYLSLMHSSHPKEDHAHA